MHRFFKPVLSVVLTTAFALSSAGCLLLLDDEPEVTSEKETAVTTAESSETTSAETTADTSEETHKIRYGTLVEGDTAPDFTAKLTDGSTFKLSDHKDKVVFLNFWATWCPYCIEEFPAFEKLKNENIKGLEMIAVDVSESKSKVDRFMKANKYSFRVAYDEDGTISNMYPTSGIPYTLIIKNGKVVRIFKGAPRDPYNEYKSAIKQNLGK